MLSQLCWRESMGAAPAAPTSPAAPLLSPPGQVALLVLAGPPGLARPGVAAADPGSSPVELLAVRQAGRQAVREAGLGWVGVEGGGGRLGYRWVGGWGTRV